MNKSDKKELMNILEHEGIQKAVLALSNFDYKYYCLFNADIADSVLHIFEEKHPYDKRPREAIEGIKKWHKGDISDEKLKELSDAAKDASYASYCHSSCVFYIASSYSFADAFATASYSIAYDVYGTNYYVPYHAYAFNDYNDCIPYDDSDSASSYAAYIKKKWKEIEQLFTKHFGNRKK